jgi:diguanylate cyclase (GGDEF)-like protein
VTVNSPTNGEDASFIIKELEERNAVLQRLVAVKTEHLNEALREISMLAVTDKLTGLCNRTRTDEVLDIEISRTHRYGGSLSVILADIDNFKEINVIHGHLTGDQVLVTFSQMISRRLRKSDIAGRWGGEEFLVICPETDAAHAAELAEKMRAMVYDHLFGTKFRISACFGVTACSADDTRDTLLTRVETALYEAKKKGKNQISVN